MKMLNAAIPVVSGCAALLAFALAGAPTSVAASDDADRYAHVRAPDPSSGAEEPTRTGAALPAHPEADAPEDDALRALVRRHARDQGLPFEIAHAVVVIESRYNPSARNGPHYGLTQINHATARAMGYVGAPGALLDPDTNLRFGLRYLGEAYRLADGDLCGTVLRYQGGHRAVRMTQAARNYCARVRSLAGKAE